MIICKQSENAECGKNLCCFHCENKETCKTACSELDKLNDSSECEDAVEVTEETSVTAFNADEKAVAIMKQIAELDRQKKALEAQDKEIRKQLTDVMGVYGVKNVDNDILKITYVAESTRTTIDSAKLKKDYPDIAEKYSKTSKVSASVRISVKG
jgi:predicted phage-related endonuclease